MKHFELALIVIMAAIGAVPVLYSVAVIGGAVLHRL